MSLATFVVLLFAGPKCLLLSQNDKFLLITTDVRQKSTFIFTADKGFEDPPKIIFSKIISSNALQHLFYKENYPIQML